MRENEEVEGDAEAEGLVSGRRERNSCKRKEKHRKAARLRTLRASPCTLSVAEVNESLYTGRSV